MLSAALAQELDRLGLVTFNSDGDTDCFVNHMPASPVDVVGIFDEQGGNVRPFARTPGVQVIVRTDKDSEAGRSRSGWSLAQAILDALDGLERVVWGSGSSDSLRVAWCRTQQAQPLYIGDDESDNPRWSVRFDVETSGAAA